MHVLDLLTVEDKLGLIIPKEILDIYNLKIGDELELVEAIGEFKPIPINKKSDSAELAPL